MKGWQRVFNTEHSYRAEIVNAVLEDRGITSVIINKQDSSYVILGSLEVHVPEGEVLSALKIIENDIDFK